MKIHTEDLLSLLVISSPRSPIPVEGKQALSQWTRRHMRWFLTTPDLCRSVSIETVVSTLCRWKVKATSNIIRSDWTKINTINLSVSSYARLEEQRSRGVMARSFTIWTSLMSTLLVREKINLLWERESCVGTRKPSSTAHFKLTTTRQVRRLSSNFYLRAKKIQLDPSLEKSLMATVSNTMTLLAIFTSLSLLRVLLQLPAKKIV